METETNTRASHRRAGYSKRLPLYDTEAGMALLHELARRRGVKASALLRTLIREEAQRAGLPMATPVDDSEAGAVDEETTEGRSIWEVILDMVDQVPDEDMATMPTDLAEQHDHYLYGTPKR